MTIGTCGGPRLVVTWAAAPAIEVGLKDREQNSERLWKIEKKDELEGSVSFTMKTRIPQCRSARRKKGVNN